MKRSRGATGGTRGATRYRLFVYLPWILLAITLLILFVDPNSKREVLTVPEPTVIKTRTSASVRRWSKTEVDKISQTKIKWTTPCKDSCNAGTRQGQCLAGRCHCSLGFGDEDCSFNIRTLYGDHEVYKDMKLRSLDTSGWDQGESLYQQLVDSLEPNTVVEVGVWKGSSATKLATALKQRNSGVFVAVDTWLPVLNFWQHHSAFNRMKDLQFINGYPDIFHTFTGNMVHENLTQAVIPFPATSRVASDFFESRKTKAEIIHIDAAHFYLDVVEDLELWWKHLRPGGIMLGDDWSNSWPGVVKAVREHAERYNLTINVFNNKWWVQNPLE
eukprot:g1055.t1